MKAISLIFVFSLIFIIGCEKENIPPTCKIISPSYGAEYEVGDIITISVEAEDEDGTIEQVRFYIDDIGVASASSWPYNYEWETEGEDNGIKKIKVSAKDDRGATVEDEISILLNPGGEPPVAAFTSDKTSISEGESVQFTDQSTNEPTSWSWAFGNGNTSTVQNPSHTYSVAGNYTVSLQVTNQYGTDTETKANYITVTESGGTGGFNEVYNPATGKTWMDRNLGASRVATSSTDAQAYGDSYQWGRGADGHEKHNSGTTSTLSSSDTPGHGNFITSGSSPYDWRSPQNNNLWQGVSGTNNPCPSGYRLPTAAEWEAERQSWGSNNSAGAFASPLKLPMAGFSAFSDGSLYDVGSSGYYWSSTVNGDFSRSLVFGGSSADVSGGRRSFGFSLRCLKDD